MFRTANHIEAALWITIGLIFLVASARRLDSARRTCLIATVTFLLFGVSDIVEASTGAWWRPWWLFLWKAACVLTFLSLLLTYLRKRRTCD